MGRSAPSLASLASLARVGFNDRQNLNDVPRLMLCSVPRHSLFLMLTLRLTLAFYLNYGLTLNIV